ncbi:MAG: hypothetical protein RBR45_10100, partial [Pseudomonas sp.]|nr:hypothetical protein [Pseudomonas sp.]
MRIKSSSGILKRPIAYVLMSVFFISSLLAFEYAFAKEAVSSGALQERSETNNPPSTASTVPPARLGLINKEEIATLESRVESLNEEKSQFDNAWRIERNKYTSMKIRIDDSKKTIRLEMDEV